MPDSSDKKSPNSPDLKSNSQNGTAGTPAPGGGSSPTAPQGMTRSTGGDQAQGSAKVYAPGQGAASPYLSSQPGAASPSMAGTPPSSASGNTGGADTRHATKAKSAISDASDQAKGAASSASTAASEKSQDVVSEVREGAKDLKDKGAEQARRAANMAKSGLSEVADQAKTAATNVAGAASAASEKVQDLFAGATDEFEEVIEARKAEAAQQLHRLVAAIDRAGTELQEEFPLVASAVKRGASKADRLAETIQERPGRQLAAEVSDVVRRRPGAAAGVLGLVGFAALRFLKATPPHSRARGSNRGGYGGGRTNEDVQRSLLRSAATGEGVGSGDPGGVSPEAPGFEVKSDTGGATRSSS